MSDAKPIDDGGPAFSGFSYTAGYGASKRNAQNEWENYEAGMTLRDWFAGKVLAGMFASESENHGYVEQRIDPNTNLPTYRKEVYPLKEGTTTEDFNKPRLSTIVIATREQFMAQEAYKMADAMIEARKAKL